MGESNGLAEHSQNDSSCAWDWVWGELEERDLTQPAPSRSFRSFIPLWVINGSVSFLMEGNGEEMVSCLSFVRDLFKRALVFPGNRSGLCISRHEELLRLRLDVRCVHDGGAQAFLCEAVPFSFPILVPSALCQGHPVSCCGTRGVEGPS